jgi:hypothetical protein
VINVTSPKPAEIDFRPVHHMSKGARNLSVAAPSFFVASSICLAAQSPANGV